MQAALTVFTSWVRSLGALLNNVLLRVPLFALYVMAPSYMDWGGWSNAPEAEICARVTGAPAEFWAINAHDCRALIRHRFEAYFQSMELIVYLGLLAIGMAWVVCSCGIYASAWCYYRRIRQLIPSPRGRARPNPQDPLCLSAPGD